MKIVRYREGARDHYGILEDGGRIRCLEGIPFESLTPDGATTQLEAVRLLSPVPAPRIFGLGLNYADHAAEGGKEHPPQPMLFMKPSTAAIGPEEPIIYPADEGDLIVHFEAELVAVIGRRARRVDSKEALDYVLGYTCGNDVSERVIQKAEMKEGCLLMGKGYDTFCPLGPAIATGLDPTDLSVAGPGQRPGAATHQYLGPHLSRSRDHLLHESSHDAAARGRDPDRDALGRGTRLSRRPRGDRDSSGGRPGQSGGSRRE